MLWQTCPGLIAARGSIEPAVGGASDPVTYLGSIGGGSGGNSGTVDIGTADANCHVIVCVSQTRSTATGRQVNSVTIDGTGGTIHAQVGNNGSSGAGVAIASRTVTGGGTITISWAVSGAVADQRAYVYKVITANTSPVSGGTGTANGDNPTATLNLGAGGFCVAVADGQGGGINSGHDVTWTNVARDVQFETTSTINSAAHSYNNAATTGASITATSIASNEVIAAVAWPAP